MGYVGKSIMKERVEEWKTRNVTGADHEAKSVECPWRVMVHRPALQPVESSYHQQDPEIIIIVKKMDFVTFRAMVINGTAQVERKKRV